MSSDEAPFHVAIVGGGITGLSLALGLLTRGIKFTIYERARGFGEIGAGIGFTPNAERAMQLLDPRIHAAFRKVGAKNTEDYFNYVDGYHYDPSNPEHEETILRLYLGERGFEGCRRSDFLDELIQHIPEENVQFRKELVEVTERSGDGRLLLSFQDSTSAEADVVIGCDGIKSKLRRIMIGDSHPAAHPSYSHKYAIRGIVPMEKARAALGLWRTSNRVMHCGPRAHALTFPVAADTLLNVVAFVTDPNEWQTADGKMTAPAAKSEATQGFAQFSPVVRAIMDLLPEQLDKWAVFDTYDNRVPTYVSGRLCLAGDAAHAASPHHGAGAGCGLEDCLALAVLLEAVARQTGTARSESLRNALLVYNDVRYRRSQWLVETSRDVGDVYEFMHPESGSDHKLIAQEIESRSHAIWRYDVDGMVSDALNKFQQKTVDGSISSEPSEKQSSEGGSNKGSVDGAAVLVAEKESSATEVGLEAARPPEDKRYLSGFKLAAVIGSFCMVCFLMMLDISILSTVS
ncbi:Monooxygenase FAD-binding protein [Macrophomina phaseolina MS6]|uniref:Monooxygenase FAD-binding protein n=1 Tax=Macrophomina phaseolina (strain MS6) TaxID=1126212 RepID=K2QNA0_MACPH|nr:Monooxygenase FAD-binding protein [Macrophomina phaseolina MS6]